MKRPRHGPRVPALPRIGYALLPRDYANEAVAGALFIALMGAAVGFAIDLVAPCSATPRPRLEGCLQSAVSIVGCLLLLALRSPISRTQSVKRRNWGRCRGCFRDL